MSYEQNRIRWDDLRVSPNSLPSLGVGSPTHVIVRDNGAITDSTAGIFNGTSSYATVPDYAALDAASMSVAMWIKMDDIGTMEIVDRNGTGGWEFYIVDDELIFSPDGDIAVNGPGLITGASHLVVATIEDSAALVRIRLYIDGIEVANKLKNAQLDIASSDGLIIGRHHTGGNFFYGKIDDIQLYNVVLTQAQITEMYNHGDGTTTLPTGITEATDLITRFQDTPTNTATLGSGYNMTTTNLTLGPGLITTEHSSFGVATLSFAPSVSQSIFFSVQLPHMYKPGTDLHPHVHWMYGTSETDTSVVWGLEYVWTNINDSVGYTSILDNTFATYNEDSTHKVDELAHISGTDKRISSMVVCRLYREGDNAADTYSHSVYLGEFDFHYQLDTLGSNEEWVK